MAEYRPALPFNVAAYAVKPTYKTIKGVLQKVYSNPTEEDIFFCSFKTFGGTEKINNDVYVVEDTANIETWFDPRFTSDCKIILAESNAAYEILGSPENINMRNQFLKFKVRRLTGDA